MEKSTGARLRDEAVAPKPRVARSRAMPRRTSTSVALRLPWSGYSTRITRYGPLLLPILFVLFLLRDALDARQLGAFVLFDHAHSLRRGAHRPHVLLLEAHRLAGVGEQHHVVLALGDRGADQVIAVVELHRDDPLLARIGKLRKGRLLDGAERGR